MKLSPYAKALLDGSTCCHKVSLCKDGNLFTGIYNGLSSWGRVYDQQGVIVENLQSEWDQNSQQLLHFSLYDFKRFGYEVIEI